jgi:hypothetical protein
MTSVDVFNNIWIQGTDILRFNTNNNNLSLSSIDVNTLSLNASTDTGKILFTSGSGGLTFDATYGASTTGTQAGAINLVSKANSSWNQTSGSLTLQTFTSGSISIISVASSTFTSSSTTSISSVGSSNWSNSSGSLSLTTTSGAINLTSAGVTAILSNGVSSWNNTSGNLNLTTTTSGAINLTSAGVTTISSNGISTWNNTAGALNLTTTTSGPINLTSAGLTAITSTGTSLWTNTSGNLSLITATTGAINLISAGLTAITSTGTSLWTNTSGSLTISTATSGVLSLTSAGNAILDASGIISIGTSTATNILLGNSSIPVSIGGNLSVDGNLVVTGTVTNVSVQTINTTESLMTLNSSSYSSSISVDVGMLFNRSVNALGTVSSSSTTSANTSTVGSPNSITLGLNGTDPTSTAGSVLKIVSGGTSWNGKTNSISVFNTTTKVATLSTNWTPIPIPVTSGNFVVSSGGTLLTATTTTSFNSNLDITAGATIALTINNIVQYYVVASPTGATATTINLTSGNTLIGTSSTANIVSPGSGYVYNSWNNAVNFLGWKESSSRIIAASTTAASGLGTITANSYLDFQANNAYFNNTKISGTAQATGSSVPTYSSTGIVSTAALLASGGIGINSNLLVIANSTTLTTPTPLLSIWQTSSSTTSQAIGLFTQNSSNEAFFKYQGTSLLPSGNTDITASIVNWPVSGATSRTATISGFTKDYVVDARSGGITSAYYYRPFYTIA